jgi:hypothetical protein
MVTYQVQVDGDDDAAFGCDLTAAVTALRWRLGLDAPASAVLTLRSAERAFAPESGGADLTGRRVRIISDDGAAQRVHFTGYITRAAPLPGRQHTTVLHAEGLDAALGRVLVRLPPLVNARAGAIIARILDAAPLRPWPLAGRWLLGRAGHSALGRTTRLAPPKIARCLDAGQTAFAYAGDTWDAGVSALEAIRAVTEAERGRFFVGRDGQAVFLERRRALLPGEPAAVFSDDMDGLDYDYGGEVVNTVRVRCLPREVGAAGTALWALPGAQVIAPRGRWAVTAAYCDETGQPLGALALIAPVRGHDFSASAAPDGTGADLTALVDVFVREAGAAAARLEIRSRTTQPLYLRLQVRGTPLRRGAPLTVTAASAAAAAFYPPAALTLDLPQLDSLAQARSIARFELARRHAPRGRVRTLTLAANSQQAHMLARTLGDRVRLHETQTGHTADYFIADEAHEVTQGGSRHRVTWTLARADSGIFWALGRAHLGTETRVSL